MAEHLEGVYQIVWMQYPIQILEWTYTRFTWKQLDIKSTVNKAISFYFLSRDLDQMSIQGLGYS